MKKDFIPSILHNVESQWIKYRLVQLLIHRYDKKCQLHSTISRNTEADEVIQEEFLQKINIFDRLPSRHT